MSGRLRVEGFEGRNNGSNERDETLYKGWMIAHGVQIQRWEFQFGTKSEVLPASRFEFRA